MWEFRSLIYVTVTRIRPYPYLIMPLKLTLFTRVGDHYWRIFWHSAPLDDFFHGNIFQLLFLTYLYEILRLFSYSFIGIYCHPGDDWYPFFGEEEKKTFIAIFVFAVERRAHSFLFSWRFLNLEISLDLSSGYVALILYLFYLSFYYSLLIFYLR